MRFEELGRHLAVASEKEAIALVQADRNFWNVVSIHAPNISRVHLRGAKRVHYVAFDDAERIEGNEQAFFRLATMEDLRSIFAFIDLQPSEPLLVHCQAGISRSAAVALAMIVRSLRPRHLYGDAALIDRAVELLLTIRPSARPNALVLRLGLEHFLSPPETIFLLQGLLNHPQLLFKSLQRWGYSSLIFAPWTGVAREIWMG
jgi:predicted protein tyrosine phosphatase